MSVNNNRHGCPYRLVRAIGGTGSEAIFFKMDRLMGRDRHSVALGFGVILSVLNLLVCIHLIKRLHYQMRHIEQASRSLASP